MINDFSSFQLSQAPEPLQWYIYILIAINIVRKETVRPRNCESRLFAYCKSCIYNKAFLKTIFVLQGYPSFFSFFTYLLPEHFIDEESNDLRIDVCLLLS